MTKSLEDFAKLDRMPKYIDKKIVYYDFYQGNKRMATVPTEPYYGHYVDLPTK